VRYETGFGEWEETEKGRYRTIYVETDTVFSPRFSTTESIDVSRSGEKVDRLQTFVSEAKYLEAAPTE
jgi:hypothetical protein